MRSRPTSTKREPKKTAEKIDGRHARRQATEEKLVDAVGAILRDSGVAAVGVNAVAERAGVDKVLVYRYFGGLEGLMEAYAARSDFWPTNDEILGDRSLLRDPDKGRAAGALLASYARAIRKRAVTLDLLAWECAHRNALTAALETVREARARELMAELAAAGFPLGGGNAELGAIIAAGLHYLALRGRAIEVFGGLGVRTEADWDRIEEVMTIAFRAMQRG